MNFELPDTVRDFTRHELIPHEALVVRREAERGLRDDPLLPEDVEPELQHKARMIGLWGIDVPQEFGGQALGMLAKCVAPEQLKHSIVLFVAPPDSPNLYLLNDQCRGAQIDKYLLPYLRGEKKSCIALAEEGAGS